MKIEAKSVSGVVNLFLVCGGGDEFSSGSMTRNQRVGSAAVVATSGPPPAPRPHSFVSFIFSPRTTRAKGLFRKNTRAFINAAGDERSAN